MKNWRRGSILATVMITALVLFTLLKALIIISHGSAFRTQSYTERLTAGYVLEAGVADAIDRLKANPDWKDGFEQQAMPHGTGTYTLTFAPDGVVPGPTDSVNNLSGGAAVDGPRGPATVPPGAAELVVTARVGRSQRVAQVFLTSSSSTGYSSDLLASGRIKMKGNVDISGISDLATGTAIDAGIHSNFSTTTPDTVKWTPLSPTDTAVIRGQVSATSSDAAAINMPGASVTGGTAFNVPMKPIPAVDIVGQITANAGAPSPAIPGSGGTLAAGTYHSGPLTINGDLNLEPGVKLYVDGPLKINGTLSGGGSIYVRGETTLQGDANLSSAEGVALYSHGSVQLTGFDGTAYLESVCAANPAAADAYSQSKAALTNLQNLFDTVPPSDYFDSGPGHMVLDDNMEILGGWDGTPQGNQLGKLMDELRKEPPGASRDFVLSKLGEMQRWCAEPTGDPPIQDYLDGVNKMPGLMLEASHEDIAVMAQVAVSMGEWDVNKLGSSFFQGSIYTNGYLYAANDVTVIGAVFARDDGSQGSAVINGETVMPGDIFLDKGVRLTINQKVIDAMGGAPPPSSGAAEVTLKSWIEL